ncbi:HlyD family type I secretion periplasmic adaptor subunit [Phaeobacter sp. LSS9]|uniref:HlyD family type I secretion periplasmic adaptor subunit n=2 Tax=unclassified Phaeobacter TaxID=2621772 RepID=UPI000E4DBEB2|nr:HlyD family type I secretion periplasmic adaptor subunit [Phaeobacter sp. LSS9]
MMQQEPASVWMPALDDGQKRGLNAVQRPVISTSRLTARVLIAALAAGLVWAANAELPELTYAKGTIVPTSYPRPVEHLDGGVLAEILVQEGQQVVAGAPLARLSEALIEAEFQSLTVREAALERNTVRLQTVVDVINGILPVEDARAELEHGHRLLAQLNAFEATRGRIQQRISELERSLEIKRALHLNALQQEETFAIESAAAQTLNQKGLLSRTEMSRFDARTLEIEGNRLRALSALADGERSLTEARREEEEFVAGTSDRLLAELETELEDLALVQRALADNAAQRNRLTVVSPVPGVVQKIYVKGPGEVVGPGELIAEVLPTQDRLIAEVQIRPADIGHVTTGDPVELKSTTFNAKRYGVQIGEVIEVSPNSHLNDRGEAFFRARISLAERGGAQQPLDGRLTAGMEVDASIRTDVRTVLDYIVSPLADPIQRAFHER